MVIIVWALCLELSCWTFSWDVYVRLEILYFLNWICYFTYNFLDFAIGKPIGYGLDSCDRGQYYLHYYCIYIMERISPGFIDWLFHSQMCGVPRGVHHD